MVDHPLDGVEPAEVTENRRRRTERTPLQTALQFIRNERELYLLLVAPVVFMVVFRIVPAMFLVVAFQDYNLFRGITGSDWVGLKHFRDLFQSEQFLRVLRNTVLISFYRIIFLFPAPIIVSLLLNELRNVAFKRTVQTVIYLPHFLSWVVAGSMIIQLLAVNGGLVNNLVASFGLPRVSFLTSNQYFRAIIVVSAGWKSIGWNTIIYLAAIAGIDPDLYEAAEIEGAGRFRKMWHITLAGISGTIVVLLLIRIGQLLQLGLDQVLMLYNPLVYETGDILSTFVYRIGIGQLRYSFSTAVGMFNSVIGFALVLMANGLSRRISDRSIW
jgi:putative aldouronate transport system permease protein